jgi:DNA-directed RNA polymerase specialized sigma24 family protein
MDLREARDGQLLAATRSRPDAFAAFYDRHETAVVGYFTRRTGDPEVAADLTAEVFAAALGGNTSRQAAACHGKEAQRRASAWLLLVVHCARLPGVDSDARSTSEAVVSIRPGLYGYSVRPAARSDSP